MLWTRSIGLLGMKNYRLSVPRAWLISAETNEHPVSVEGSVRLFLASWAGAKPKGLLRDNPPSREQVRV